MGLLCLAMRVCRSFPDASRIFVLWLAASWGHSWMNGDAAGVLVLDWKTALSRRSGRGRGSCLNGGEGRMLGDMSSVLLDGQ